MVESCSPGDYPKFGRLPQATIEEKAAKLKNFYVFHGINMSEWNEAGNRFLKFLRQKQK